MKILFLCLSNLKFNIHTPRSEPLGGTESAVSYLAPELSKLGHAVSLMANTLPQTIEGVWHHPVNEDLLKIDPDVVVLVSAPQAAPGVKKAAPNAKIILWNHMQPDQPAMAHMFQPEYRKAIDHIVYVSESQRLAFVNQAPHSPLAQAGVSIGGSDTTVIGNAIAPCFENMFKSSLEILEYKKCKGVYTSTPYRGLAILGKLQELPIEVYSSMRVYQGDDQIFSTMYESLKNNECLKLNGSVSQKDLARHLREIAFLVYPSIFTECHSIAILEAMAAGLKVITTDMASPKTEFIDSMSATSGTFDDYTKMLRDNINLFRSNPEAWSEKMYQQVQYINAEYTWKKKALHWDGYLQSTTV